MSDTPRSLKDIRLFLLDMDGTMNLGAGPLPGAAEFLRLLRARGLRYLFLTNNSSANAATYASRYRALGFDVQDSDFFTSGAATALALQREGVGRVFLLGTPDLHREFEGRGIETRAADPQWVVLGFDRTLTWEKLKDACLLVRRGVPWLVTHPDVNCPSEEGPVPDTGALMEVISLSTGVACSRVIGKPSAEFVQQALAQVGVEAGAAAMVGDRLYTDMEAARNAGIMSILVLSGETDVAMLEQWPHKPDLVIPGVGTLCEVLSGLEKPDATDPLPSS